MDRSFFAVLSALGLALGCASGGGGAGGVVTSSATTTTTSTGATTISSITTAASTTVGASGGGGAGAGGSTGSGSGAGGSSAGGAGGAAGAAGSGGTVDVSTLDQDGDGWTPAEGDCCDVVGPSCQKPALVNPGAFEYPGNGVDDDCDPTTADLAPPPSCSPAALFSNVTASDLLRAMDLCQFTEETPASPKERTWGVINGGASLLLADGVTALPILDNVQVGVLAAYGDYVAPTKNATMAAISSGAARAPTDPLYVHPQNGSAQGQLSGNFNGNTQVKLQDVYLAPHGGKPPVAAQCAAGCTTGCDQAYDSVNLRARIRVPTNAKSFSYQFKFYSAEFPEYLCQAYNDFFVTLLKSTWTPDPSASPPEAPLPVDTNIAFDALESPVSVNNGFFQVCFPPFGAPAGTCPSGTLELIGTGMGGWGSNLKDGGGTEWLTNSAPVVPGEIIELQFIVWDAGDHNVDSLVLLDHFRWSITPAPVGVSK